MEWLTNWVANITLFVLVAIIIDLLIPTTALQRYAKMVISLLLIVILLHPILKIFNTNIEEIVANLHFYSGNQQQQIENLIENKKNEIQASQRAYILEEMAVQLKSMAEEEIAEKYGMHIQNVQLQMEEDDIQSANISPFFHNDVRTVKVVLTDDNSDSDSDSIAAIKKISIDTSTPLIEKNNELSAIQYDLAHIWQLEKDQIKVVMEGGNM